MIDLLTPELREAIEAEPGMRVHTPSDTRPQRLMAQAPGSRPGKAGGVGVPRKVFDLTWEGLAAGVAWRETATPPVADAQRACGR